MAIEGVVANSGSGGNEFAIDNVNGGSGTVSVPYAKLMSGADGAADLIGGDAANGLDVDVTRVSGNVAVTNAGLTALAAAIRAEDSASASADTGVGALVVQLATPADTAADGDYSFLQMAAGRLWVDASGKTLTVASHAVTNAGTFAVQAAITAASASISSGAIASGAVASGAFASGSIGSGAIASGAVASGAFASGSIASGAIASGAIASGAIAVGAIAAGATSIADNEDAASADGDRGIKILAVRKATPANTSGADGDYEFLQMSGGKLWTTNTFGGTRSYKTASGTLTADTDVVAAVSTKRIKVYALSVTTVGTNANAAIWKSNGTSGTELWRTLLQGASGSPMGERLAVSPGVDGAFLFATVAGEKLTLDVGNGDTLHYSLSYWDDDAT